MNSEILNIDHIKSYGFTLTVTSTALWFEKEHCGRLASGHHIWKATIIYNSNDYRMKIICDVSGTEETFFEGYIETKSEFDTLLKQIRILEDN